MYFFWHAILSHVVLGKRFYLLWSEKCRLDDFHESKFDQIAFQIVVGDQDGIIQLFSMKKDEMVVHFKTLPGDKVQSIQLSGTPGSIIHLIALKFKKL